jgi:hypothetical protein
MTRMAETRWQLKGLQKEKNGAIHMVLTSRFRASVSYRTPLGPRPVARQGVKPECALMGATRRALFYETILAESRYGPGTL